jgi:GxxExxY protein
VNYNGEKIDFGFRIDILVESTVVLGIKAVDAITPVHQAQLVTFLKLSRKHVALLIKLKVVHLRDGIRRMVCGEPPLRVLCG